MTDNRAEGGTHAKRNATLKLCLVNRTATYVGRTEMVGVMLLGSGDQDGSVSKKRADNGVQLESWAIVLIRNQTLLGVG